MSALALPVPHRQTALRLVPVDSDHMAPTLKPGDAVAVVPVTAYRGEGLYILDVAGVPVVHRAQGDFRGGIALSSDSPAYPAIQTLTPDQFRAAVLGKVTAVCAVVDPGLMRGGW